MATTLTGFLRTPGELTIPPDARLDGTQHRGVAVLVTRITLAAPGSGNDKAVLLCEWQLPKSYKLRTFSLVKIPNCLGRSSLRANPGSDGLSRR